MFNCCVLATLLLATSASLAAQSNPSFELRRDPYPNYAETIAQGDFNGDGLLDIALTGMNGEIAIFRNVGGKSFVHTNTITLPSGTSRIIRIRSGDVDANGTMDLAVLTNNAAYVLWGDGHGNFKPVHLASYAIPADLNVGDLNQDGNADIMVTSYCAGSVPFPAKNPYPACVAVDVFYGQGNQTTFYRRAVTNLGVNPWQPWAVDVNGDGIADIAMGTNDQNGTQGGIFVWLGHPDGPFDQTPQRYITTSNGASIFVPGDFNRDGMIDFADTTEEFYINGGSRAPCATGQISPTLTVCQPVDNTYLPSPVRIQATTYDKTSVTALQEYVDYNLLYSANVSSFDITLPEDLGPHLLVAKAWDAKGVSFRSDRNITVYSGTPGPTCPAALGTANICLPESATSGSPVHILANGHSSTVPTAAQLYIDGKLVINDLACNSYYCAGGTSYVDTYQSLSNGAHSLTFNLWDSSGNSYAAEKTITVE